MKLILFDKNPVTHKQSFIKKVEFHDAPPIYKIPTQKGNIEFERIKPLAIDEVLYYRKYSNDEELAIGLDELSKTIDKMENY